MSTGASRAEASRLRGGLALIVTAMLAALLLATVEHWTAPRISANIEAEKLRGLQAILPPGEYDNEPHLDVTQAFNPDLLGSEEPLPVYRARNGDEPVAAVFTIIAPNGYAGPIELLVAVGVDGTLSGVRAIDHTETPGLGDKIESGKSDWTDRFRGLSTADPLNAEWTLTRDGGTFDQITGATVTSRAVLQAAGNAVLYFAAHRDEILTANVTTEEAADP